MKIIYIMGKSGSGKHTMFNILTKDEIITFKTLNHEYDLFRMGMDEFDNNGIYLVIGDITRYQSLKKIYGDDLVPIYLYVNDKERLIRNINGHPDKLIDICKEFIEDSKFTESDIDELGLTRHVKFNNNSNLQWTLHKVRSFVLKQTKKERERD